MRRESRTQDVIHVSREVWDKMRWCTKRIIYKNVKVIDNDKEGGDKQDDGRE